MALAPFTRDPNSDLDHKPHGKGGLSPACGLVYRVNARIQIWIQISGLVRVIGAFDSTNTMSGLGVVFKQGYDYTHQVLCMCTAAMHSNFILRTHFPFTFSTGNTSPITDIP